MVLKLAFCSTASVNKFENDVKVNGTQTRHTVATDMLQFENDVKVNGTQTGNASSTTDFCLRMM